MRDLDANGDGFVQKAELFGASQADHKATGAAKAKSVDVSTAGKGWLGSQSKQQFELAGEDTRTALTITH
jgi:hypothetical protein